MHDDRELDFARAITVLDDGQDAVRPASVRTDVAVPARIAQRYEVIALLGVGGMGRVYKVRDLELDEIVALKFLRAELVASPPMLERFRQEVRLARRVTHHNVARTYDIGEHEGSRFLTMEFIDGESLGVELAQRGRLEVDAVVELGLALCGAMSAAHAAGVVHRDLKPDNIMVDRDGRIVVTDFGIASGRTSPLHGSDRLVGTAHYMAPEQVEGIEALDGRADIYAAGAVLFEALTGAPAWPADEGDSLKALALRRLVEPPPDPRAVDRSLPGRLCDVVVRCLATSRDDRFVDADELCEALRTVSLTTSGRWRLPSGGIPRVRTPRSVPSSGGADPMAVELYLRARDELRQAWAGLGDLSLAVDLFERGLALAPDEPGMCSGYAMARARQLNYASEGDAGAIDDVLSLAAHAIELAPHLGEPWLARATVEFVASRWPQAATSLRVALERTPGLLKAHELLAAIEREVGCEDRAIARFARVLDLDPDATGARLSLAGVYALLGRLDEADACLATLPGSRSERRHHRFVRLRLDAWRRRCTPLPPGRGDGGSTPDILYRNLYKGYFVPASRANAIAAHDGFVAQLQPGSRFRALMLQFAVELRAIDGDLEATFDMLERAVDARVYDLLWMQRCPLLEPVRHEARFEALLARVEAHAAAVRAAIERPLPSDARSTRP